MHFGQTEVDVQDHIAMVHPALDELAEASKQTDAEGLSTWIRQWLTERAGEDAVDSYWRAGPFEGMWSGLNRYWEKTSQ